MSKTNNLEQEYFSPNEIARKAGLGRTTIYKLEEKYHFIHKLGRRSLIKWTDFVKALDKEMGVKS